MSYEYGETTAEIRTKPDPIARKPTSSPVRRHSRFGLRAFIAGLALGAAAIIITLAVVVITHNSTYDSPVAKLFGMLTVIGMLVVAGALVSVGGREHVLHTAMSEARDDVIDAVRDELGRTNAAVRTIRNDVGEIHDFMRAVAEHLPGADRKSVV